jgi:ParB-like chromosome segregation protein Spo0J
MRVGQVALRQLRLRPDYDKQRLVGAEMVEIVASCKLMGQTTLIFVCPDGTIDDGGRRYAAALELGWEHIWCWVMDEPVHPMTEEEMGVEPQVEQEPKLLWEVTT